MPQLFDITPYLAALEAGCTLITANGRIAAKARAAYSVTVQSRSVMLRPQIISLSAWLDQRWQYFTLTPQQQIPTVLSKLQRQLLWREVIANNMDAVPLLKTDDLAATADTALANIILWQLTLSEIDNEPNHSKEFQLWARHFLAKLTANNWITPEQRQALLLEQMRLEQVQLEQAQTQGQVKHSCAHLIGFDDIPPLTHSLLASAFNELHIHKHDSAVASELQKLAFNTRDQEIAAAAHWAKTILETNPKATVAIISPTLGQNKQAIENALIEQFEPHYLNSNQARYTLPFNFSAGTPLAQTPLVHDTIQLLRLSVQPLPFDLVCQLLTSPFWFCSQHPEQALCVLKLLHQAPKQKLSWADLRAAASRANADGFDAFVLKSNELIRQRPKSASASDWMDHIHALLAQLGWPGERRLDSNEYQQVTSFYTLLEQLLGVDQINSNLSFSDLIELLSQQAAVTPFQAKTPDSPVQILGVLEAASLRFDYCWVVSMDNQVWPPPASPNPMLPTGLQKRAKMPNGSAAKQLEYAKSLTDRFHHCADEVIFSYARLAGETELLPSGLIADVPHSKEELYSEGAVISPWGIWQNTLIDTATELWIDCERAETEYQGNNKHSGGVGILQWQAQQPMNAFLRYRLQLRPLPEHDPHLPAFVRGQIIHEALALIWKTLGNQTQLKQMPADDLSRLISDSIDKAIHSAQSITTLLTPVRAEIEKTHAEILIKMWLECEQQRDDFHVVVIEQESTIELGELALTIRIDRVDAMANNELMVIDYKTGSDLSINNWYPDRLEDPQLPLYAHSLDDAVAGISYGAVNRGKPGLKGVSHEQSDISGLISCRKAFSLSWPDLQQRWSEDLNQLAHEYISGCTLNIEYSANARRYQADYLAANRILEKSTAFSRWQARDIKHV